MQNLPRKFEDYLFENLGVLSHLKLWKKEKQLPYFLRDRYMLYECDLLTQPWLVMISLDNKEETPATIRKHIAQLQKEWDHEVLYLSPAITAYNRKRFIEHKIGSSD